MPLSQKATLAWATDVSERDSAFATDWPSTRIEQLELLDSMILYGLSGDQSQ